jgi:hypothetical protein
MERGQPRLDPARSGPDRPQRHVDRVGRAGRPAARRRRRPVADRGCAAPHHRGAACPRLRVRDPRSARRIDRSAVPQRRDVVDQRGPRSQVHRHVQALGVRPRGHRVGSGPHRSAVVAPAARDVPARRAAPTSGAQARRRSRPGRSGQQRDDPDPGAPRGGDDRRNDGGRGRAPRACCAGDHRGERQRRRHDRHRGGDRCAVPLGALGRPRVRTCGQGGGSQRLPARRRG